MKTKHILIVSLILTILTIGAVSASDNITDDLAADGAIDESALEVDDSIQDECKVVETDDGDITGDGVDMEAFIPEEGNKDNDYMPVVILKCQDPQTGNLTVYVDDSLAFDQTISRNNYISNVEEGYYLYYLSNWQLTNQINTTGIHKVDAFFNGESLASGNIYAINYDFSIGYLYLPIICDDWASLSLWSFPNDATGILTLTVNNKTYNWDYRKGPIQISTKGWKIGRYTAVATYSGDDYYLPSSTQYTFDVEPKISGPGLGSNVASWSVMALGEKQSIDFIAPGADGMVEIRITDDNNNETYHNVSVSNGYGSFSLSELSLGYYRIYITGQIGGYEVNRNFDINVIKNSEEYTSGISTSEIVVGNPLILTFKGPLSDSVYILIDGVHVKTYKYCIEFTDVILGLAVGTHKIRLMVDSSEIYINTYVVTVKQKPAPDVIKMTLKKVKVKKSAKKLVLSSTLKINGKAVKGKIVKFKFNKKTYSAKTNAKGIAKVTIKKSVLKKLKAGKKITYQASYGKTVKKIAVKVAK